MKQRSRTPTLWYLGIRKTTTGIPSCGRSGRRSGPLLNSENPDLVNIGSGEEITILRVAELIAEIVGFQGASKGFVQARWYSAETQRYQSNQIDWLEPSDLSEGRTEVCYQEFLTEYANETLRSV